MNAYCDYGATFLIPKSLVILFPFWLIILFSYIFLIKKLKQTIKDKNPHKLGHEYKLFKMSNITRKVILSY